jgi:hypothetical protein
VFGSGQECSSANSMGLGAGSDFGVGPSNPSMSRLSSASALLHATSTPNIVGSELSSYLDSDTVHKFDDDFNILDWWYDHKLTYPVLFILARDILSVPVLTMSLESTFSLVGGVIEECRRLGYGMMEILSLFKDWEAADARLQHTTDEKALS